MAFLIKLVPRQDESAWRTAKRLVEALLGRPVEPTYYDRLRQRENSLHNRFTGEFSRQDKTPYFIFREAIMTPSGTPCTAPPWGTVSALNLNTGKKLWDVPLGTMIPARHTGSINLGGPIVTAGGLVFTGASTESYIRAFDSASGQELWKDELPVPAQATPMTYMVGGKQFVVICAGGHGQLGTKLGDSVVAFALK